MLPSGITTLLCHVLAIHPAPAVCRIHVVPLSVDRHTSFLSPVLPSATVPPINTMLPSGRTTLLWPDLAVHPAAAFTSVQDALYGSSPKYHAQPVAYSE
jgi:hypothetical protein